jgi:hypothetical protein
MVAGTLEKQSQDHEYIQKNIGNIRFTASTVKTPNLKFCTVQMHTYSTDHFPKMGQQFTDLWRCLYCDQTMTRLITELPSQSGRLILKLLCQWHQDPWLSLTCFKNYPHVTWKTKEWIIMRLHHSIEGFTSPRTVGILKKFQKNNDTDRTNVPVHSTSELLNDCSCIYGCALIVGQYLCSSLRARKFSH